MGKTLKNKSIMKKKIVTFEVNSSFPLTGDEIYKEILETEVKMNTQNKLRFHLKEINEIDDDYESNVLKVPICVGKLNKDNVVSMKGYKPVLKEHLVWEYKDRYFINFEPEDINKQKQLSVTYNKPTLEPFINFDNSGIEL
jgi:hypothetical protein